MDPTANLDKQLTIAAHILQHADTNTDETVRLAELVEALDGWIRGGGFLPSAWRKF